MLEKHGDKLEVVFDGPEAKGTVLIERGAYGLYLTVPGLVDDRSEAIVLFDLFYASEEGSKKHPNAACAVHLWSKENPIDDPAVAVIYYWDRPTEVRYDAAQVHTG